MSSETIQPAGFWIRVVASIIDGCILAVIGYLILTPLIILGAVNGAANNTGDGLGSIFGILIFFIYLAQLASYWIYPAIFYKKKGATPGKMLLGLKVVDVETGAYLGFGKTFLREIVGKIISAIVFMLGFIIVGFRKDKRGLHDLIAGTQVIRSK